MKTITKKQKQKDDYMDLVKNPFGPFKSDNNNNSHNNLKQPDVIDIRKGWNKGIVEHNLRIALNA